MVRRPMKNGAWSVEGAPQIEIAAAVGAVVGQEWVVAVGLEARPKEQTARRDLGDGVVVHEHDGGVEVHRRVEFVVTHHAAGVTFVRTLQEVVRREVEAELADGERRERAVRRSLPGVEPAWGPDSGMKRPPGLVDEPPQ